MKLSRTKLSREGEGLGPVVLVDAIIGHKRNTRSTIAEVDAITLYPGGDTALYKGQLSLSLVCDS